MLSLFQIQRLADNENFDQLIRRVLSNGRCLDRTAAERLCGVEACRGAALGLALQRTCELTYGLDPVADALAQRLLSHQRGDGMFGLPRSPSIAATAIAVRALALWLAQASEQSPDAGAVLFSRVEAAVTAATRALARHQDADGSFGDDVDDEIALWQLSGHAVKRWLASSRLNLDALARAVRNQSCNHSQLRELALLAAA